MKKYYPFAIVLAVLCCIVVVLEFLTLRKTNGVLSYPLDDAFIHMAVAKNVALHHIWGLSNVEWVSSSSSVLFTILLSTAFAVFGLSPAWPLILSATGAVLLLLEMQRELNRHTHLSTPRKTITMLATMLVAPLPFMTILGMEHSLQMALTLIFVHRCATRLENNQLALSDWMAPALWGALMISCRYENAYTAFVVCCILALRKSWKTAFVLGIISISPVVIFGAVMAAKGGYFLPNSLILKGKMQLIRLLNDTVSFLEITSVISGLFVITGLVVAERFRRKQFDRAFYVLTISFFSIILHCCSAAAGYLYRYEAYLLVLTFFHLTILFMEWWSPEKLKERANWLYIFTFAIFLCNLVPRAANSLPHAVRCSKNIYDQQYQMALFLKQYYNHNTIAANDVGAISYLGDIRTLDLWGLGSNQVTRAKLRKEYTPEYVHQLIDSSQAKVAVIYEEWYLPGVYKNWHKIASWEISNNYICAYPTVCFYATVAESAEGMYKNLKAFEAQLPRDVTVKYFYNQDSTSALVQR